MNDDNDTNDANNILVDSIGWRAVALEKIRRRLRSENQCKLLMTGTPGLLLECPKCHANNVIYAIDIGKTSDCWQCRRMLVMGIVWGGN